MSIARTFSRRLTKVAPPVVWGVLVLLLWQFFVRWRHIKPFVMPAPSDIWQQLRQNKSFIWDAAKSTGTNAVVGLLMGVILGVGVALVAQRFVMVKGVLSPIASALNTMPIVALAPVFYDLFGATSDVPRRVVVALAVFFPVFVNTLKGLTQIEPVHQELMRSYAASDADLLRVVRLPNAMPFVLTGVRIAASVSVIAAVVVEYFGGLQRGLGYRVASAMNQSRTASGWAYIAAARALGLLFYVGALALELVVMPWQAKRRAGAIA